MAGTGDGCRLGRSWKTQKGRLDPRRSLCSHLDYTAKIGDIYMRQTSRTSLKVPITDIVIHQDYKSFGTVENDIALALLEFPVNYTPYIQPVCFPEKTFMVQAGTECWVTGWGKLHEKGETVKPDRNRFRLLRRQGCSFLASKEGGWRRCG